MGYLIISYLEEVSNCKSYGGYLSVHMARLETLSLPQEFWETFRLDSRAARVHHRSRPSARNDVTGADAKNQKISEASLVHNDSKRKKKEASAPAVDRMATHRGEGVK